MMTFRRKIRWGAAAAAVVLCLPACAQISLSSAVDLALRNSPKVKMAQADVVKAKAARSESKDAFIPIVSTSGGVGKSSGPPLAVPVVFSVTAQSLVFNFSQADYIRAANAAVSAAEFSLQETRNALVEDAVSTYIALDNAQRRRAALTDAVGGAGRLVTIAQERFDAGVDPHIELSRAQLTGARLKLQQAELNSEMETLSAHLGHLTGFTSGLLQTVPSSIPEYASSPGDYTQSAEDSYGVRAAFSNAKSKEYAARGDARYKLRPQFAFGANYSRVTTAFSNYSVYYPAFSRNDNENALSLGIQITVPLLDFSHQARARASAADALRSRFEAEDLKLQFLEGRAKLGRGITELSARAELASRERDLAQDELDAIRLQLQSAAGATGGQQMNPKDEQNALLQERQKALEMLNAELQLRQAEITLMRQQGSLGDWLRKAVSLPAQAVPTVVPVGPQVVLPSAPAPGPATGSPGSPQIRPQL